MKKFLPIKPSPIDERDFILESVSLKMSTKLPDVFDMRTSIGPPRDQGADGACAAFTAACMKEYQEYQDVGFDEYMSPQFIYDNRENQTSSGMYSRDVMKILNKIGSVPENDFPYQSNMEISDSHLEIASNYRIKGYASIRTINALKESLYNNGPALIAVPVFNYGKYIWKPEGNQKMIGGHAMAIVGWNEEGFIIRNSWGKDWEDDGYTTFPYSHWGMQWEIWTTVDADSEEIAPIIDDRKEKKGKQKGFFNKILEWLVYIFS